MDHFYSMNMVTPRHLQKLLAQELLLFVTDVARNSQATNQLKYLIGVICLFSFFRQMYDASRCIFAMYFSELPDIPHTLA
jgi:hypothetical protein